MSRWRRRHRAHSVDKNQSAIVDALRECGHLVHDLSAAGGGVPDLLVGAHGRLLLFEVKRSLSDWTGGKRGVSPSDVELTKEQVVFHRTWQLLPVYVVHDPMEALQICAGAVSPPRIAPAGRPLSVSSPPTAGDLFPANEET